MGLLDSVKSPSGTGLVAALGAPVIGSTATMMSNPMTAPLAAPLAKAIPGLSGISGESIGAGTNFAPSYAGMENPYTAKTAQDTLAQNQKIMKQQQDFVNALSAQGGIGNQAAVFQQQQNLANQLATQAAGGGPNPALAQLNETTAQNIQNQAALMGSTRGASANPGLVARNAAMQGSQIQQQAAAQAATMRAQQQLGAQNALAQQLSGMGGLASQQVAQQMGAQQALAGTSMANQGQVLGSLAAGNQAAVSMQGNMNQVQGTSEIEQMKARQQTTSGLLKGATSAAMMAAHGGMVPRRMFDGGTTSPAPTTAAPGSGISIETPDINKPASMFGRFAKGYSDLENNQQLSKMSPMESGFASAGSGIGHIINKGRNAYANQGDEIGETDAPESASDLAAQTAAHGGKINVKGKLKDGGKVPGKAKVTGDSLKNDNVKALLSPGEIVIPRSIVQGKNAPKKAAEFVASILARQGK